jgi:translation elongation factor EF-Tu-like GTPase
MPIKAKRKSTAKKSASRKPAKKAAAKKTVRKKSVSKKVLKKKPAKKKTAAKKKALRKKTTNKPSVKTKKATEVKMYAVEPGPPPPGIPPVEEPSQHEEAIGTVTHYYSHLGVAIVQINKGTLKTGDTVRLKGHSTDFSQPVESMELEHQHIDKAEAGQSIGLLVKDHAREHDIVYRVT